MNHLRNCFSKEIVNITRQSEIDIAKGLCVILMVFTHAFENVAWFFDPEVSSVVFDNLFNKIIGNSFGAPLFMLCMGISFCYSKKNDTADLLKRAAKMLVMAFSLEILRTAIPGLLEWLIFRDPECIEYVYYFFAADILQFATLVFLTMALFRMLKLKPLAMLFIAALASVAGQLLCGLRVDSVIANTAVGYLWYSGEMSYFPLLNWLIFPICGYAVGNLWMHLRDKDKFFRITTPILTVISVIYFSSMAIVGEWYYFSAGNYCGMGLLDALFTMISAFSVIGISYLLFKHTRKLRKLLAAMGERITSIYCIHWTIYGFLYLGILLVIGDAYLPRWSVLPVGIAVLLLSNYLSALYARYKSRYSR
ncbi:MAG: heparan-alpha-glucosaminide N-acetyltransferase domain-containing protein [Bacillota bacterium]|nr:heparan-alpha-glucosaminide N-acetyltransferase domain-containing protein [Bacillota bacterium]